MCFSLAAMLLTAYSKPGCHGILMWNKADNKLSWCIAGVLVLADGPFWVR